MIPLFLKFSELNVALAESQAAKGLSGLKAGIGPMVPMLLILAVFYFLIIRPQAKKQKLQQKFLTELKRGDMVITQAGIIGTIRTLSDKFITLEVDDDVCLKIVRSQIQESASSLKDDNRGKVAEAKTNPAT